MVVVSGVDECFTHRNCPIVVGISIDRCATLVMACHRRNPESAKSITPRRFKRVCRGRNDPLLANRPGDHVIDEPAAVALFHGDHDGNGRGDLIQIGVKLVVPHCLVP